MERRAECLSAIVISSSVHSPRGRLRAIRFIADKTYPKSPLAPLRAKNVELSGTDSTLTALNKPTSIFYVTNPNGGVVDSFNPTTKTQAALTSALQAASAAGNPEIRPAHLLVALLTQTDGIAAPLLKAVGVDPATVRTEAQRWSTGCRRPAASTTQPQLCRESLAAITAAQQLATEMDDEYVSTEHLLVGLATGDSEVAQAADRARRHAAGAARGVRQGARQRPGHQRGPRGQLPGAGEVLHRSDRRAPARASSTRSSGATTRFVASCRCCPAAPRTTRC